MVLFRKHSAAPTSTEADAPSVDDGSKGRATPSRKQAEAERKERLKATARGEVTSRSKSGKTTMAPSATAKAARNEARQRVLNGDERALSARDAGPERRFARDFVDSRHTVGEYFLYMAIFVLIIGLFQIPVLQFLSQILLLVIVAGLAIDSFRIHRGVSRALAAKFPTSNLKGIARYAVMRGMVTRRMRVPKPQVARGSMK